MKNFKLLILTLSAILFVFGNALAVPINVTGDNGETDLQTILNNITVDPDAPHDSAGFDSSIDVNADQLSPLNSAYWSITGSGGSTATFIIEIAGYALFNKMGIYDFSDYNNKVELFSGAETAGNQAWVSIKEDGSVYLDAVNHDTGIDFAGNRFGYYLENKVGNVFFSDSNLNTGGSQQMVAFQGNDQDYVKLPGVAAGEWTDNEFILAWEDLLGGGGSVNEPDFNDMVVMVESVLPNPVPEPATMVLLGLGLIGLGTFGRKKGLFAKK